MSKMVNQLRNPTPETPRSKVNRVTPVRMKEATLR